MHRLLFLDFKQAASLAALDSNSVKSSNNIAKHWNDNQKCRSEMMLNDSGYQTPSNGRKKNVRIASEALSLWLGIVKFTYGS